VTILYPAKLASKVEDRKNPKKKVRIYFKNGKQNKTFPNKQN
jgi:hypothetical protein